MRHTSLFLLLAVPALVAAAEPARYVGQLVSAETQVQLRLPQSAGGLVVSLEVTAATTVALGGQKLADVPCGAWLKITADEAGETAVRIERGLCPWAVERAAALQPQAAALSLALSATGSGDQNASALVRPTAETAGALLDALTADGFLQNAAATAGEPVRPGLRLSLVGGATAWIEDAPLTAELRARLATLAERLGGPAAAQLNALLEQTKAWPLAKTLAYDLHDGYFVKHTDAPDPPVSFAVLRDQPAFDRMFGAGFVMDDPFHRLPKGSFAKDLVATVVHAGQAYYTYLVRGVTMRDGVARVDYTVAERKQGDASFACPLIVRLPNAGLAAVAFVENGKLVQTVRW